MYQSELLLLEFLVKYLAYPQEMLGYRKSYYTLLGTIRLVKPNYPDYFEAFALRETVAVQVIDVDFEIIN